MDRGRTIDLGAVQIHVTEAIPPGHKVALRAIAAGDPVIKYGSSIGLATSDIPAGAHVHTHNVASSRGRGDLPLAGARGSSLDVGRDDPELAVSRLSSGPR